VTRPKLRAHPSAQPSAVVVSLVERRVRSGHRRSATAGGVPARRGGDGRDAVVIALFGPGRRPMPGGRR
jgi:hypothetical protein